MEITHDGRFLFAVNTGSGTISRYSIARGGALTLLGSTPVGATGGVGAVDARLSPDGRTLYVDESKVGAVGAFAVTGGNLTELATSPSSPSSFTSATRSRGITLPAPVARSARGHLPGGKRRGGLLVTGPDTGCGVAAQLFSRAQSPITFARIHQARDQPALAARPARTRRRDCQADARPSHIRVTR